MIKTRIPQVVLDYRKKDEKFTLSLRLNGSQHDIVESLPDRTGCKTAQEGIREAIVIYDFILSEKAKGNDTQIVDPETGERQSLFGCD